MTATVETWDEAAGRGWVVTTWPRRGRRVLILRGQLRAASIRQGREKANLTAGDVVQFVALANGGVARRISRSAYADSQPFAVYARPGPVPPAPGRPPRRVPDEDVVAYRGEDNPDGLPE